MKTNINIPLDDGLKQQLESIAKKYGLNLASYIRMKLIEIVKKEED